LRAAALTSRLQPEKKSQILAVFVVFNHNQGTVLAGLDGEACMREAVIPLVAMILFSGNIHPLVTQIKSK
jgi:hypothetical protein